MPERIPGDSDPSPLHKLVTHALDQSLSPTFDRLLKAAPVSEDLRRSNLHTSIIEPQNAFVVTAIEDQSNDLFGNGFDGDPWGHCLQLPVALLDDAGRPVVEVDLPMLKFSTS